MKKICVTDMHTGGGPLRIITSGYPEPKGSTVIEKLRYLRENLDQYRTMLMHEPRGHYYQYGALLVTPDHPDADIGAIFMHNDGYSTMCGHATIALGRYIVDNKLHRQENEIKNEGGAVSEVIINIQAPCGLVKANVSVENGVSGALCFTSVPAFAFKTNISVCVADYGNISLDIGYGGAFYALVDVKQVEMDVTETASTKLVDFGATVTETLKKEMKMVHPDEEDLSWLSGTILTDGNDDESYNLCVFADHQLDRSPCGSGVTARMAVQYAKGLVKQNEKRCFYNGKVKSKFVGEVIGETTCGPHDAVRVQVQGEAFYTGTSEFFLEEKDPLKHGFVVR